MMKLADRPESGGCEEEPKIRRKLVLKDSELGKELDLEEDESVEQLPDAEYKELFLGQFYGVGLSRSKRDSHVRFTLLAKRSMDDFTNLNDPGKWYIVDSKHVPHGNPVAGHCDVRDASSYFIFELAEVLIEACNWLKKNAYPDEASSSGCCYTPSGVIGWDFDKIDDD